MFPDNLRLSRALVPARSVLRLLQSAALLTYILCEWFSDNFVVNFVVLAIFLACDFWTVSRPPSLTAPTLQGAALSPLACILRPSH